LERQWERERDSDTEVAIYSERQRLSYKDRQWDREIVTIISDYLVMIISTIVFYYLVIIFYYLVKVEIGVVDSISTISKDFKSSENPCKIDSSSTTGHGR